MKIISGSGDRRVQWISERKSKEIAKRKLQTESLADTVRVKETVALNRRMRNTSVIFDIM